MTEKTEKKLLVVDDSPVTNGLLERIFTNDGYRVSLAWDGAEAIRVAREGQPHLILLDILMEGMGGKEVARRLRSEPETREIPIIFISNTLSNGDGPLQDVEIDGDIFPAFAKPFDNRKLMSAVRKAVNLKIHEPKPGKKS